MKLTTFILIIAFAQVSAKGLAQRITLNEHRSSLENVLTTIKKQSGYVFFARDIDLQKTEISVEIQDATIEEALRACLRGLPYDFKIEGKNVVLAKKMPSLIDHVAGFLRQDSVIYRGKVLDAFGQPLPGASVKVKGTKKATFTTQEGNFAIFAACWKNFNRPNLDFANYLQQKQRKLPVFYSNFRYDYVYNRYGEQVFSSTANIKNWDGKYNGKEAPAGVYDYLIDPRNGRKIITGSVTVLR